MQPLIKIAVDNTIDAVIERGECDFVESIASEIPLILICDVLGIPREDRRKLYEWSNKLIGFDDPDYPSSGAEALLVTQKLMQYAFALADHKRSALADDITSILMQAEVDGEKLTDLEFGMFMLLLIVAGNETTRNAITGGIIALQNHPEAWEKLASDPERFVDGAVEEILRWVSPLIYFRRTATRDMEMHGTQIHQGDKICMYYPSANRDEQVFDRPNEFNIERDPNPHVAFGTGEHFCLGAMLARLEMRHVFLELPRRMPDLQITAPPVRLRSNFINGVKKLSVRFTPGTPQVQAA